MNSGEFRRIHTNSAEVNQIEASRMRVFLVRFEPNPLIKRLRKRIIRLNRRLALEESQCDSIVFNDKFHIYSQALLPTKEKSSDKCRQDSQRSRGRIEPKR